MDNADRHSFEYEDLLACGRGELFGPGNAQLPLPPMLMFDRITEIMEKGGEHGKGLMRAELDVKPDLWFFPCHFKGDPVMPGCLGLDALWQMVGFFPRLDRRPGKGRALGLGELKFSGQVLPNVNKVVYGIDIKRVMRSKLVLGIADGWLSADGEMIYRAKDLKVGLFKQDEALQPARLSRRGLRYRPNRPYLWPANEPHKRFEGEAIMRRVVVTGMGIVSSIGNNTQEVLASLHEAKSGITRADKYAELGFRCQVQGAPTLDPADVIDRRAMRFLGEGAAWNHVAMEQAIRDSGVEEKNFQRTHRHHHGLGRAVRRAPSWRPPTPPASKGPKRVGPFAVPKAMSSTASATLATWFKIKGVNYSISSACATSNHCIGNAYETDPVRQAGHDLRRRLRRARLVAVGPVRRDGRDVLEIQRYAATASRAYDIDRDGFVIAGGAGVLVLEELEHAKARGAQDLWRNRRLWRDLGRLRHGRAVGRGRRALHAHGDGDREGADRLHQSARHLDAGRRSQGDRGDPRGVRRDKCPPISATKSLTGHSLGATGVQEAIYSLLMMNNGFICESANIEELDPAFADMPIVRERIDNAKLGSVLSNSFGFGGTNASLVFKRLDA